MSEHFQSYSQASLTLSGSDKHKFQLPRYVNYEQLQEVRTLLPALSPQITTRIFFHLSSTRNETQRHAGPPDMMHWEEHTITVLFLLK